MRKGYILVSLFVVTCFLLAACSTPGVDNGTPAVTGSPQTGLDMTDTPGGIPVTGNDTLTPAATTAATEATQATTQEASPTVAATSGTPSTSTDPGLLTNEMKFQLVNGQAQALGQAQDFVLDFVNQKIAYVIVALTSTTSGTAGNTIAVPMDKLQIQDTSMLSSSSASTSTTATPMATLAAGSGQFAFVYTGDATLLTNAPAFSADSLPQLGLAAGNWDAALISYWSGSGSAATTPAATAMATDTPAATATMATGLTPAPVALQGVALASKVIGFSIMDASNPQYAKISDVVVDITTGAIKYVIVNVSDKLYAVPLPFLGTDMQNQALVLMGGSQILQNAPSFDASSFPVTTTANWDSQIATFWQNMMVQPTSTVSP